MEKIYKKSLTFINNWKEPKNYDTQCLKISVVIPVYHAKYLKEVLNHLSKIDNVYEVITVFDGLDDSPEMIINEYNYNFIIVQHKKNLNAPAARNTGAAYATGDVILFLDQDMILSPSFIPKAISYLKENNNHGIILGFRDNVYYEEVPQLNKWKESNYENDWRIKTTIDDSFMDLTVSNCGSIKNNCDNIIKIYEKSDGFRKLGTKKEMTIGFWDLPSMVISHSLAITKEDFFKIGGFPEWIQGWGGEDIALGFLATANHLPIIPILVGSYHIKHLPLSGNEEKKWAEMRKNLKKYKKWSRTIDEFPVINKHKCFNRSIIIYKKSI